MKLVLDLTGLTIETPGSQRLPLEGNFDAMSLVERMIYEWVPYFECHKCGRFDYCKFVLRFPNDPHRARDIKCGVVESVLRLFVKSTFPILAELSTEQRQAYLDAAFHFETFVFYAETLIGDHRVKISSRTKVIGPPGTMGEGLLDCEIASIALQKSYAKYPNSAANAPYYSSKDGPKKLFSTSCVNRVLILSLIS